MIFGSAPARRRRSQHDADPRSTAEPDLKRRRQAAAHSALNVDHRREIRTDMTLAVDVRNTQASAERHRDWRLAKRIEEKPPDRVDAAARARHAVGERHPTRRIDAEANVNAGRDHDTHTGLRRGFSSDDRIGPKLGIERRNEVLGLRPGAVRCGNRDDRRDEPATKRYRDRASHKAYV